MAKAAWITLGALLLTGGGAAMVYQNRTAPMPEGQELYVRWEKGESLRQALTQLEQKGVVKDAEVAFLASRLKNVPSPKRGTYQFRPGMTLDQVFRSLGQPVRRMVTLREGRWIAQIAQDLEKAGVCKASDYIRLANEPSRFSNMVSFPLPSTSLEGYLYPDTYDLPPMLGAEGVILLQLRTFQEKVVSKTGVEDLHNRVIVASMVEREASDREERKKVAGVIQNRIERRMPLQIDATVLYALQEWRVLGQGVVRTVKSPYNTYLKRGLPPGPIGSPTLTSIEAAFNPAEHDYLFYVARPGKLHYFAKTYPEHNQNINRARAEFRALGLGREDSGL
ncbi:MAG: endolytic transglycosylase MltG [Fimbriimonadaceae bacterium]|nr:endolytic transglycosylase MltG [Fimbriimonadaceae bacterium]